MSRYPGYRYPNDRVTRFLHLAIIICAGLIMFAVIIQVFVGRNDIANECEDKGGKMITDRWNRSYCVEVIE